jgi:hypothetical protein
VIGEKMELFAQIIGIVAMTLTCVSFQCKEKRNVLLFQLCGSAFFTINFYLLGAFSGALLNAIGIFRAIVFINEKTFRSKHPAWLVVFCFIFFSSYLSVFALFGKPLITKNIIVEFLPVIAMIASTISFRYSDAKTVRFYGLISSPLWLTYNIICFSVGAIICEVLNLFSIVIGILRFDIHKHR